MRLLITVLLYLASAVLINALPHHSSVQDELELILQQSPLHTTVLMEGGAAASAPTRVPLPGGSRDRFQALWAGDYEKAFEGYVSSSVNRRVAGS